MKRVKAVKAWAVYSPKGGIYVTDFGQLQVFDREGEVVYAPWNRIGEDGRVVRVTIQPLPRRGGKKEKRR